MATIVLTANTSWYIYNFRRNTIKELVRKGFEVHVISPRDEYTEKIKNLGCHVHNIKIDGRGLNPLVDAITCLSFFKFFIKIKPQVVLNFTPKNNIYSSLAASPLNISVINNIAGLGHAFINDSFLNRMVRQLYKISQKRVPYIFFQNEEDMGVFEKNKIGVTAQKERIPGSGADLKRFAYSPAPQKKPLRFLLTARMLKEKGVYLFADAARYFKEKYGDKVEFSLLGFCDSSNPSSVTINEINTWVGQGIINYLGVTDKVENVIKDVHCVVLPSYYREGVPKSLLEAGAMGKPIITTDNVGCRETVVDGFNGYLCNPRSLSSLIDAMEKIIISTEEEIKQLGENSRKHIADNFDETIVIDRYLSSINKAINNDDAVLINP
jgi:glycosyltransferase involved in cell wall biosynthesis